MDEKFTIGDISKIFNISRPTLRYWEQEHLIDTNKNNENGYREYNFTQMIHISDIIFYRRLNIPIKELKNLNNLNSNDLKQLLIVNKFELQTKIDKLSLIMNKLETRLNLLDEMKEIENNAFQESKPDIDYIVNFKYNNYKQMEHYLEDQYNYVMLYNYETNEFVSNCLSIPFVSDKSKIILDGNNLSQRFLLCVCRISINNIDDNNIIDQTKYLKSKGYTIGIIILRYLYSACDTDKYDYFKMWIEVK